MLFEGIYFLAVGKLFPVFIGSPSFTFGERAKKKAFQDYVSVKENVLYKVNFEKNTNYSLKGIQYVTDGIVVTLVNPNPDLENRAQEFLQFLIDRIDNVTPIFFGGAIVNLKKAYENNTPCEFPFPSNHEKDLEQIAKVFYDFNGYILEVNGIKLYEPTEVEVQKEIQEISNDVKRKVDFFVIEKEVDTGLSLLAHRMKREGFANGLIIGPSGYGKTTVAKMLAVKMGLDFCKTDFSAIIDIDEVLVMRSLKGGEIVTKNSKFTDAVVKGNCVILMDEFNRVPPNVNSALMGFLDDTRKITYFDQTFEVGKNTIFIATMNLGPKFLGTFNMDSAMLNRFQSIMSVGSLTTEEEINIYFNKVDGLSFKDAKTIVELLAQLRASMPNSDFDFSPRLGLNIANHVVNGASIREGLMFSLGNISNETKKDLIIVCNKQSLESTDKIVSIFGI